MTILPTVRSAGTRTVGDGWLHEKQNAVRNIKLTAKQFFFSEEALETEFQLNKKKYRKNVKQRKEKRFIVRLQLL